MRESDGRPESLEKRGLTVDVLLARGGFSGAERERILQAALRDARIDTTRGNRRRIALMASSSLAAAALLVLALQRPWRDPSARSKGDPHAGTWLVTLECIRGEMARCSQEATLLFRVEGATHPSYLFAYAEALDGVSRTWFFSASEGRVPNVQGGLEREVLRDGVRLQSLAPGHYDVHVIISPEPLTNSQVLARRGMAGEQVLPLEVIR